MPLTVSTATPDPYARFARLASVYLVAVEKLRIAEPLNDEERASIPTFASELALLSEARELRMGATVPSHLHRSFSTLLAIDMYTLPKQALDFKKASSDLDAITRYVENNSSEPLPTETLDRAQDVCYNVLVLLTERRPVPTWR